MPELKLFAFDLDGTLYSGEAAVSGAIKLVEGLRKGYKIAFFTNNSWKTAAEVLEKLSRLGFECRREEVYAASSASVRYLKEAGLDNLFVIGSPALRAEVREAGLRLLDDGFADNLVVALDYGFGYDKIAAALSILTRGGKFVACNEDPSFPAGAGKTLPGCGAMVAAVAAASRRRPDFIVGKPHGYMLSAIARDYGVEHGEIVVVGDSYESDIRMALDHGSKAVLVGRGDGAAGEGVLAVRELSEIQKRMGDLT
jgi:HAD superfamily hydrolase (TIGR01450 family)